MNKIISLFLLLSATSAFSRSDFPEKLSDSRFSQSTSYELNFPLWTDGAIKDRFYYIPKGKKIDNTDFSAWKYPEGTQLWKNFSGVDGKIETRTMLKKKMKAGYLRPTDGKGLKKHILFPMKAT